MRKGAAVDAPGAAVKKAGRATKKRHRPLVHPRGFCYMQPRRSNPAYHDAVVAELVDAQR